MKALIVLVLLLLTFSAQADDWVFIAQPISCSEENFPLTCAGDLPKKYWLQRDTALIHGCLDLIGPLENVTVYSILQIGAETNLNNGCDLFQYQGYFIQRQMVALSADMCEYHIYLLTGKMLNVSAINVLWDEANMTVQSWGAWPNPLAPPWCGPFGGE